MASPMEDEQILSAQRNRIEKLVREITPHGRVEFDPQTSNQIAFRIIDQNTGTVLAASGQFHVNELTGKSDEWIRQYIHELGGGDI
jgi:hypothetical protein